MATTTNYNWSTPDDTALVKDGAAAIRTLGSSIDTTTKALNPSTTLGDIEYRSATANTNTRLPIGTTGQVLSVVGGVPAWVAANPGDITAVNAGTGISGGGTSGDVTITNSMATAITTNGDLIYGTGSGTFTRRGIGATGEVLTVSGGVPTWATAASPNLTIAQIATGSMTGTTVTISSLSSYDTLYIRLENISNSTQSQDILRINASSSAVYDYVYTGGLNYGAFNNSAFTRNAPTADTSFQISGIDESATSTEGNAHIILTNCKNSGFTKYQCVAYGQWNDAGTNRVFTSTVSGIFKSSAAVSSISITQASGAGSFDAGTYTVWGA